MTGWTGLVVLLVALALSGTAFRFWGGLAWYESLMMGLLISVLVVVAVARLDDHVETWRDLRDLFRR